jgi:Ca2+-binding EF-hand superfamily protein
LRIVARASASAHRAQSLGVEDWFMQKNYWLLASALSVASAIYDVSLVSAQRFGGPDEFAKLDSDGDGTVTVAELEAGFLARWTATDSNQDGKVTVDEFEAQSAARERERFAKQDTNSNGLLERSEVSRMPDEVFTKLDTDGSGTLTQAELAAGRPDHGGKGPGFGGHGLRGDTDNDGAVSKAEATAEAAKIAARMDADGDGKITQEELASGHGGHHAGPPPATD